MDASTRKPRTFTEHTTLLGAFASLVDALSPTDWQRIAVRCRPLAGSTPAALFARAQLRATPQIDLDLPGAPAIMRAVPLTLQSLGVAMWTTYEVVTSAFPSALGAPWTRQQSTGREDFDRRMDAQNAIEHAMARHRVRIPSVAAAVRAAAHAVSMHDWLAPAVFERAYQWLEPELPYTRVDPASPSHLASP
jgi:hypothetical protein